MTTSITIATRKSRLALWQAEHVKKALLQFNPELNINFLAESTAGDRNQNVSLATIGGKELFAKELQQAVIDGKADIAVHSVKDLGAKTLPQLKLAAILKREDPRDVLISTNFKSYKNLPQTATIGTASPRRTCQLLHHNPNFNIQLLRGNVETRLKKLFAGNYDAIILAAAGLHRLNLSNHITEYLSPEFMLPAIGQGAIGVECRADDSELQQTLSAINHPNTHIAVSAERAVNATLGGDCFTPIAAHAHLENDKITVHACVGSLDGQDLLTSTLSGKASDAEKIGHGVAKDLIDQGAQRYC